MTVTATIPNGIFSKNNFTNEEVAAINGLIRVCSEHDAIEIKMDTPETSARSEEETRDFLWYANGNLVGYLSFFVFTDKAEVGGLVHPEYRRRGIFRELLAAACDEMKGRGVTDVILPTDKKSPSGEAFIKSLGAGYSNSEYSMKLNMLKEPAVMHPELVLRRANEGDFEFMVGCAAKAFGDEEAYMRDLLIKTAERTSMIAELDGERIGLIRAFLIDEKGAYLHLFSVLPELQGKGYGRQILTQAIRMMQADGRDQIELDVECANENALGLYKSVGFEVTAGHDFYRIDTVSCDITAPVRGQLAAYNSGDIDGFMKWFAEDCTVEDGAGNLLMQGAAAMRESYGKMFAASPNLHCRLASRTIVGNYILDEERVTGRAGSGGEERHVVAVYRVENGLIQHVRFLR